MGFPPACFLFPLHARAKGWRIMALTSVPTSSALSSRCLAFCKLIGLQRAPAFVTTSDEGLCSGPPLQAGTSTASLVISSPRSLTDTTTVPRTCRPLLLQAAAVLSFSFDIQQFYSLPGLSPPSLIELCGAYALAYLVGGLSPQPFLAVWGSP